jgi:hypothetical protein
MLPRPFAPSRRRHSWELAVLPHGSEPLRFLRILNGMRCRACPYLRGTRKEDIVLNEGARREGALEEAGPDVPGHR